MNVRLKYSTGLYAGSHYDGQLVMNRWELTAYMITNTLDPEDQSTAFDRFKYFISYLDSTVFVNSEDLETCQRYANARINITTLPGEPGDQLVGLMLYHKLNAIMEDRIQIFETEISSLTGGNMTYIHSAEETTTGLVIPDWWNTPDLVHCDPDLIDNDKVLNLHKVSAWRDLDLSWVEETTPNVDSNTIVFADFGKDDTK